MALRMPLSLKSAKFSMTIIFKDFFDFVKRTLSYLRGGGELCSWEGVRRLGRNPKFCQIYFFKAPLTGFWMNSGLLEAQFFLPVAVSSPSVSSSWSSAAFLKCRSVICICQLFLSFVFVIYICHLYLSSLSVICIC